MISVLFPVVGALLGAGGGFCVGAWWCDKFEGPDDLGIGMFMYGMFGALVGGFFGVLIGAILATQV